MKINRKVLSIALTGAIVPWGFAIAKEDPAANYPTSRPLSSVGRIGDSPSSIGDGSSAPRGMELLGEDHRPEAFRENVVDASKTNMPVQSYSSSSSYYPAGYAIAQDSQSMPMDSDSSVYDSVVGYQSSSHGKCSSGSCGRVNAALGWAEVDALLWWGPNSKTPPLAVQGPLGSTNPTTVLAGGDSLPLGGNMQTGLRANVGVWLDDCQSIGVGGRAFGLLTDGTNQTFNSNGSTTLGIPFFNTSIGSPDTYLVALNSGNNGSNIGSITISNKTSFIQAEAYGRFLLAKSAASRADLLGGYTFARLDDSFGILSRQVDGISGNGIPNGTVTTFNDRFSTQNTFHGGHIGFTTDITRGCWAFSTLSKVSLGNMHQVGTVAGSGQNVGNQGFFARNTGVQSRDVFAFLPEAGAKLRYRLTERMQFNVGYTFLFFSDIATAGGLIDRNIDISPIGTPTAPVQRFAHDSYYLHGIDLGLIYSF